MAKKKPVPAMYPKPATTKIAEPQKIVAVEKKRGKLLGITIEVSPELQTQSQASIEIERHRFDLIARLRAYKGTLLARINPHCGERPKHIPAAKWGDIEQRAYLIADLPDDAPGEARDALLALRTLSVLNDALIQLRDMTPVIKQAVCSAIDLGMLLQRGQTQIDHGEAVDVGRRNVRSRSKANQAKSQSAAQQSKHAEIEFNRLIAKETQPRMRTATLANMAEKKDRNGNPIYGSLPTLKRYAKTWKSITPSE